MADEPELVSTVVSPDGCYRIERRAFEGDPRDSPEVIPRLVEEATGKTIFERHGFELALGPGELVTVSPAHASARTYLLDPRRRIFALGEAPDSWQPLAQLEPLERSRQRAVETARREHRRRTDQPRFVAIALFCAAGALVSGTVAFFPPSLSWIDFGLRMAAGSVFLFFAVFLYISVGGLISR